MPSDFDRVCQALSPGWKLNARSLETQDRFTLTAPMPPGCREVAKWLALEGLEPGPYKCTLRAPTGGARGTRQLQRQKLRKIGPLGATVRVLRPAAGWGDEDEEEVVYEPDPQTADPVATETYGKVDQLKAEKQRLEAEIELEEVRARAERLNRGGAVDPATAALADQVRSLAAKVETLQTSRQDRLMEALLRSMMESQAAMQAQLFSAFTGQKGAPGLDLAQIKEFAEMLSLLRDEAGGTSEPNSELGAMVAMLRELRKGSPSTAQPALAAAPAAPLPTQPGTASPSPAAGPNGAPSPSPPAGPPDLGRQRVGHFLQQVHAELAAQADPVSAADRCADSPLYDALPVPVRDALEDADFRTVLDALAAWSPPELYQRFYTDVAEDESKLAWLVKFLQAVQHPEQEPETVFSDEKGAGEVVDRRPGAPSSVADEVVEADGAEV